jgi:hypothetical protein
VAKVQIRRPEESEYAPYFARYIKLVADDDPLSVLLRQREECAALFSGISDERSLYRHAEGKWTIRAVVTHMSDTERTFSYRALWFARGLSGPLPSIEQDTAADSAEADRLPWKAVAQEFDRVRLASISLFENFPDAAWDRQGIASGNAITVRALAFLVVGHVAHHLGVLRSKYL